MKSKSNSITFPPQWPQKPTNSGVTFPAKTNEKQLNPISAYSDHVKYDTTRYNGNGYQNEVTGLRQLFETQLKDLYAAVKAIIGVLPTMIKKASSGELTDTDRKSVV